MNNNKTISKTKQILIIFIVNLKSVLQIFTIWKMWKNWCDGDDHEEVADNDEDDDDDCSFLPLMSDWLQTRELGSTRDKIEESFESENN